MTPPSASAVPTEPEKEQPKSSPVLERVIPIQVESQPVPNEPKPIAAEPKPIPAEPKPVPVEPNLVPDEPKLVLVESVVVPTEAEAILVGSEVVPADPAAVRVEPEVVSTVSEPEAVDSVPLERNDQVLIICNSFKIDFCFNREWQYRDLLLRPFWKRPNVSFSVFLPISEKPRKWKDRQRVLLKQQPWWHRNQLRNRIRTAQ